MKKFLSKKALYLSATLFSLLFCVATITYAAGCASYGVPENGYPKWQERASLVWTNIFRMSPQEAWNFYKPGWPLTLQLQNYPPVAPLQYNYGLNYGARVRADDIANTEGCVLDHSNCAGVSATTVVAQYYPNWASLTEIATGRNLSPFNTILYFIAENTANPCPDGANCIAHRNTLMSPNFTELGNGYATGPNQNQLGEYWFQEFGRPQTDIIPCSQIFGGVHDFASGVTRFLLNYYDFANSAPQSANVVIDGIPHAMNVFFGTGARGTYKFESPTGASCRTYHFEVTDYTGSPRRYPMSGEFQTFGEGSCTNDYVPSASAPMCSADFNQVNSVTVQDVFDFINAWFAGNITTDFDQNNTLEVADIFGFLNAWFVGCGAGAVDTTPPSRPTLFYPANTSSLSAFPTFVWSAVADDLSPPVKYHLQVATNSNFAPGTAIVIDQSNLTSTSYVSGGTFPQTTYYVRVQAIDAAVNAGNWSQTASFTYFIAQAGIATITAPLNGAAITGSSVAVAGQANSTASPISLMIFTLKSSTGATVGSTGCSVAPAVLSASCQKTLSIASIQPGPYTLYLTAYATFPNNIVATGQVNVTR